MRVGLFHSNAHGKLEVSGENLTTWGLSGKWGDSTSENELLIWKQTLVTQSHLDRYNTILSLVANARSWPLSQACPNFPRRILNHAFIKTRYTCWSRNSSSSCIVKENSSRQWLSKRNSWFFRTRTVWGHQCLCYKVYAAETYQTEPSHKRKSVSITRFL